MKKTVLIGATRAQMLPALVCEYSIRCRSTGVEVAHTFGSPAPEPEMPKNKSKTGFSFVRFTMPKRAGYEGLGVYLDSDMILCESISPLFDMVTPSSPLVCTKNLPAVFAMMMDYSPRWDVTSILIHLDCGYVSYQDLLNLKPFSPDRTIPDCWNSLDELKPDTKILHYTDMSRQPWRVVDRRPVCEMWWNELRRAVADGFIARDILQGEVEAGHVIGDVLKILR